MNTPIGRLLACTFLVALIATRVWSQTTPPATGAYYFGTWVGAASRGTADGAGGTARFSAPAGLALDSAGNLYVVDTLNSTIRKITAAGVVSTFAGSPGESGTTDGAGAAARFYVPNHIVAHVDGNLYVGEGNAQGGGRIRRVTRDGMVTLLAGGTGTTPVDGVGSSAIFEGGSLALASEPAGTLLAADPRTIRRVEMNGAVTTLFRKDDVWINSRFSALARDASGNLYVACNGVIPRTQNPALAQARIYRISPGGSITTFADETNGLAGVGHLHALALDAQQNLYAAGSSGAVYRFSAGNMTVYAGMPGSIGARDGAAPQALFSAIYGLAFDAAGNLFVSELNNTIRRVSPAGVVSTVAGLPEEDSARHLDAKGTAARLNFPGGIAISPDRVAYLADTHNHVIRRIGPDGTVTTLAGAPGESGYANGVGAQARFNLPAHLALDASGNVYVSESSGAVRKITPTGEVVTLAGGAAYGQAPAQDGQGSQASFGWTTAIAVSPSGDIYVAEASAYSATQGQVWPRLRKISPTGAVTTVPNFSGGPHSAFTGIAFDPAGVLYVADPVYMRLVKLPPQGAAEIIRFDGFAPRRIAIDASGNVFMTDDRDFGAGRVARYSSAGQFEIIGGDRSILGHHDAIGTRARFSYLNGIAIDANGSLYLTDENNTVRKGILASAPTIATQPMSQTISSGGSVTLSVATAAVPEPTYQWYFNGAAIAGATASSFTVASASSANAGNYHVVVTNELGSATSATATLTVSTPPGGGGSSGGSNGGGGGAPSEFFVAACAALASARAWQRRSAQRE